MNKRYTDELIIDGKTTAVVGVAENATSPIVQDIVIEFIDSILTNPTDDPLNRLRRFYQVDQITQPTNVGLVGAVKGSMFDAIWTALGSPANGVTNVLWDNTNLPRWHVRFETQAKIVRILSLNLRPDYLSFLVGLINEHFRGRAGGVEINQLSIEQHEHFIIRINETLQSI